MSSEIAYTSIKKLTIWFLRKYVWVGACYTDALVCIARRLNIVDRAMIFEAIVDEPYAPARTYLESTRLHGYELISCYTRKSMHADARIDGAPADACHHIRQLMFMFRWDSIAIDWIVKCARMGNMVPLETVLTCMQEFTEHYTAYYLARKIMHACNDAGLVDAVLMIHASGKIDHDSVMLNLCPETYEVVRKLGYLIDYNALGRLKCVVAGVWTGLMTDNRRQAEELCEHAIKHGIGLDWVHKHMTVDEMAEVEVESYSNKSIRWLLANGYPTWKFWFDSFSMRNVACVLPHMSAEVRGIMLARSGCAREAYMVQPYEYNRDVFMQLASYKVARKFGRFG